MPTKTLLLERDGGDFVQRWYLVQRTDGTNLIEHQYRDTTADEVTSETQSEEEFSKSNKDDELGARLHAVLAAP